MARKIFSQLAQEPGTITPTRLKEDVELRQKYYNLLEGDENQPLSRLYLNPSSNLNVIRREPFISKEIEESYGTPITAVVQAEKVLDDTLRLSSFLVSPRGFIWLGKQVILQNSNTRPDTRDILGRIDTFVSNVVTSPIYNALPITSRPSRVGEGLISRIADLAFGTGLGNDTSIGRGQLLDDMFKEAKGETDSVSSLVSSVGNIVNSVASVFSGKGLPSGQPWSTLAYMDTKLFGLSTGINIPRRTVNTFEPKAHGIPEATAQFSYNEIFSEKNKRAFSSGRTGITTQWAPSGEIRKNIDTYLWKSPLTDQKGSGHIDQYIKLKFGYNEDNSFEPSKSVEFRGNIIAFSDNINATWEASEYIGVPVELYWYQKTVRDVQFGFNVYIHNSTEFSEVWKRIQELKSLMYPSYTPANRPSATFMWLTLGDLFVKAPMIIRDMTTTIDETYMWEVEDGFQAPHGIEIQIGGVILYKNIPTRGENNTIYNIKATELTYLPAKINPIIGSFTPSPVLDSDVSPVTQPISDNQLEEFDGELNTTTF